MTKKWFHERNDRFLNNLKVNITFEELHYMTPDQFKQWCHDACDALVDGWDNYDTPPVVGLSEPDMIDQFNKMSGFNSELLWDIDENTGQRDVIRNKFFFGSAVNQFFPTMYKTPIKTSMKKDGKSVYDYLSDPAFFDGFHKAAIRNFQYDSFYHFSQSIKKNDKTRNIAEQPLTDDPVEWVRLFEEYYRGTVDFDYWVNPIKSKGYTGFNQKLFDVKYLWLTKEQMTHLGVSGEMVFCDYINNLYNNGLDHELYEIRFYEKKQRLFPKAMKAFRISYGKQIAVNFPPLIAKALYEKYTEHIVPSDTPIKIYDPSMGWGGRILGAMSVSDDRVIHYIGTDPNTDHSTEGSRTKYHEVADFFNSRTTRSNKFFTHQNTYEIYQLGSEVIKDDVQFQKHKGTLDLVFTSPPYFAKEVYSNDDTQSCNKFGNYIAWRDGFLRPTLETAVDWLRSDRYLLWNIADAEFDGVRLPLEADSKKILESLGMEFVGVVKMALAQMPGANRLKETEEVKEIRSNTLDGVVVEKRKVLEAYTKNSCKVNGLIVKYEPIFVFRKP